MQKIVIFGDSITAGWRDGFVSAILKREIRTRFTEEEKSRYTIVLHGVPGEDTNDALGRIEKSVAEQADLYVVFFGANDAAIHHEITPEKFEENLSTIATLFGKEKTLLITPPRYDEVRGDASRGNALVEQYRKKTLQVGEKIAVPVIDLYQAMQYSEKEAELLADDGLHFTQKGYDLLASLIVEYLRKNTPTA